MKKSLYAFKGMTIRNLKVYFKDRMAIIFSMLTPIIVLGLYLIFLKDTYVSSIQANISGLENLISDTDIQMIVNAWLVAGVIGTSVVTVALNSLSVIVTDKQNQIDYDYNASPVKSSTVFLSYFTGAFLNTLIISFILLTAGLAFIAVTGGFCYSVIDIITIYGLTALGALSGTLVLMVFASFFKKTSTLNAFSVLVSAGIGFVIGAYIPVSQFDESVQNVVNLVPGSQIAGMMRNTLMNSVLDKIDISLNGIDNGDFFKNMQEMFALKLNLFGNEIEFNQMMIFSIGVIIIFLILNLISYKLSSKNNL